MDLGVSLTSSGHVRYDPDDPYGQVFNRTNSNGNTGRGKQQETDVPQIALNTEARDTIRDLFPNIPEKDLREIITTSFQKVSILFRPYPCSGLTNPGVEQGGNCSRRTHGSTSTACCCCPRPPRIHHV